MTKYNTTQILKELRSVMRNKSKISHKLNAYIIPSQDGHQSEYIADCDKRRSYISGFTGSMGTAIITETKAALWTDGRYHFQAEKELDHNWAVMKQGLDGIPSETRWLGEELIAGSIVGIDPHLITYQKFEELSKKISQQGHSLIPVYQNLVDLIWSDRPLPPANVVYPLETEFHGQCYSKKIQEIRKILKSEGISALIVTALDEVAYLFNLRGSDIEYNPVFFAYAVVTMTECLLFMDEKKLTPGAIESLMNKEVYVEIKPYESIKTAIELMVANGAERVWVPTNSSYAICEKIPERNRLVKLSPIALMKAVKNTTEREGMRRCHIRDGVALCRFLCWLENEILNGKEQTEISAAKTIDEFRSEQENFMGLSFETISAVGGNASFPHYRVTPKTDLKINTDDVYLVDSGAQYKDGTTDVTRTVHFGTPREFVKECFTRVLKGHIAVARTIFPAKLTGSRLDTLARKYLWDIGLDYGHGTSHGVGMFLNVHEGPIAVTWRTMEEEGLDDGMFISNEPGYYENEKFGIRIENIVEIVSTQTPFNFSGKKFLTFENVTMAPIQTKLISPSMLTSEEIEWLNDYHSDVLGKVGNALLDQGHIETYNWLVKQTQPIG